MKPIELTEEHKFKLLEMCNELFPEKKWFKILCGNIYYSKNGNFPGKSIHWFEFCTKIGHNIFSRKQFYYNSEEFITFMKIMCLQDKTKLQHPVDYLYEEFKKLK